MIFFYGKIFRCTNNFCVAFFFILIYISSISAQENNFNSADTNLQQAALKIKKVPDLVNREKYQSALKVTEEAQAIFSKHAKWEDYVNATIIIAEIYSYLFNNQLRLEFAEKAIEEFEIHEIKEELILADAKLQKAGALLQLGDYATAISLYRQLSPTFEKEKNWKKAIECNYYIGEANYYLSELDSAKTYIEATLNIGKKRQEDEYLLTALNLLSVVNFRKGDYQQAIKTTLQIIEQQKNISTPTKLEKHTLAAYYKNLGAFYTRKGEYKRALAAFESINRITDFKKEAIYEIDPQYFTNVGKILSYQKRYADSNSKLKSSIFFNSQVPISKKIHQNKINAYSTMAFNWLKLGASDSASLYLNRIIDIPLEYKRDYTHYLLGRLDLVENKVDEGLKHFNEAITIQTTAKRKNLNLQNDIYRYISQAYARQKKYESAIENIHKSLNLNVANSNDITTIYHQPLLKDIAFPIDFLETIHLKAKYLAKLSPSLKDQKASLSTYQLANQWVDSLQTSYVLEGAQLFWSKRFKEVYEGTIKQAHHLYQLTGESKYIDIAFETAEKSKALLLLEGLKDNESQAIAGLPDSLIQKEKDLKLEVAFYEKSLRTATEKKQEKRIQLYQSYLADKRLALGNLKEQMEQDYPDYYQLKYTNTTVDIAQLQTEMLNEQSAFIEYFIGDSTAFAFVISKNDRHFFPIVAPDILAAQTDSLQQVLIRPADIVRNATMAFEIFNQHAYNLYQSVLDVALARLSASIDQLIISPDGVLNDFPFEVLNRNLVKETSIDFGQLPYLIQDYQTHYVYSANLWKNNQEKQHQLPSNTDCLALAPPYKSNDLIAQRGSLQQIRGTNNQLEGTGREIQAIAQHFNGQFDWSAAANEANFKNQAQQFGLLHLAMHGEVTEDDPRLIFTDIDTDTTEDNYLYPYEIANMDLQAQLAVLSACETGLGKYVQGEGVMSLARSFMSAGVPSLVMSLWKVNDLTTSELMPTFYKQLAAGQTKKEALHTAKKRYLQKADLEYRHPYYWSGFVLLGDETNLKTTPCTPWWYIGGGLFLLLGLMVGYWRLYAN